MIEIDGSRGEGGGQVVRSSLALSLATGQPCRIERIRAGRQRPGLQRQHLAAVLAARDVGHARVTGAELNSTSLEFHPQGIRGGDYRFDIGSAGSTTLVLQTVLPALALAEGPSTLTLVGGTHNPLAPPFDFIDRSYLPLWRPLGVRATATLHQAGFFPAGGGKLSVSISPADDWRVFDLIERGAIGRRVARALLSNLPDHVGERECRTLCESLGWRLSECRVEHVSARGPGNVLLVEIESDDVTEVFASFGERGVKAEEVAARAARDVARYLASAAPIAEHLADQWMLPLAIAAHRQGSTATYRASAFSEHATTHAAVIEAFLNVRVARHELAADLWEITVGPA